MSARGLSRRGLFAGTAAVAVAPAAVLATAKPAASISPDAALIATCEAFNALELQSLGLHYGATRIEDDDERTPLLQEIIAKQEPLLANVVALRATTFEGLLARGRTALLEDLEIDPEGMLDSGWINEGLQGAIWRDLAELSGISVSSGNARALAVLGLPPEPPEPPREISAAEKEEPTPRQLRHPDAELIRLCDQHIVNHATYNREGGLLECDGDPLWHAYERTTVAIDAAKPQTIAGLVAKARAAQAEGAKPHIPESEWVFTSNEEKWGWDLINDLIRLYGGAA